MHKSVFVVVQGEYENYCIRGVFSTVAKALEFTKELNKAEPGARLLYFDDSDRAYIEERFLDEPESQWNRIEGV